MLRMEPAGERPAFCPLRRRESVVSEPGPSGKERGKAGDRRAGWSWGGGERASGDRRAESGPRGELGSAEPEGGHRVARGGRGEETADPGDRRSRGRSPGLSGLRRVKRAHRDLERDWDAECEGAIEEEGGARLAARGEGETPCELRKGKRSRARAGERRGCPRARPARRVHTQSSGSAGFAARSSVTTTLFPQGL